MNSRFYRGALRRCACIAAALLLSLPASMFGQAGTRRARLQLRSPPRRTLPRISPATGFPLITEDWRFRMVTPAKGDYASVPLNPDGPQGRGRVGSGERRSRRVSSVSRTARRLACAFPAALTSRGRTRTH